MTTTDLLNQKCLPAKQIEHIFSEQEAQELINLLEQWEIHLEGRVLKKHFKCKNFMDGISILKNIADIAEADDHHPDLHLTGYKNIEIELSTHAHGGLTLNDFIVAAKIDALLKDN